MPYYYFCLVLIFFYLFLIINVLIQKIRECKFSVQTITYCLILAILYKYNFCIDFWGLEYEDAYSFSFCARQFSYDIYPTSFLIDAISIGSLETPLSTFTYGGHFITYPVFLSIFTNVLGWSPSLLSIINTLVAFFILLILSVWSKEKGHKFILPAIYCFAPIINVFTTCFLSETFSSLLCISFLFAYLKNERFKFEYHLLSFLSLFLAILCKRENLALLLVPIINIVWQQRYNTFSKIVKIKNIIWHMSPFIVITLLYLGFCQNVFNIENTESLDIGQRTFSIEYFIKLFPVFVKSLFSIKYFSIVVPIIVSCCILVYKNKAPFNRATLLITILFIAYLFLYSSHYRGYFFINDGNITEFETFRYLNNFYYLIPLLFGTLSYTNKQFYIRPLIGTLLCFSLYMTIHLRIIYSDMEKNIRFNEVGVISDYIENTKGKSILICENILLYQNKCNSDFNICDITQINSLNFSNKHIKYYLRLSDIKYLKERYNITINTNCFTPVLALPDGTKLYVYKQD